MRNKTKFFILGVSISALLGMTACGKETSTKPTDVETTMNTAVDETLEKNEEVETNNSNEKMEPEEEKKEEEVVPEETKELEQEAETNASADSDQSSDQQDAPTESNVAAGEISDEWTDMDFVLDGVKYSLPVSYHELEANGWTFDLAAYGYADGYIMNAGDKTYGTIELENSKFNEKLGCTVGFINLDSSPKDITDCEIWCFHLETDHGFKLLDNVPSMTIAKGISMGSTREEVIAAFGETDDVYEATDYGYCTLSYKVDYTYYLAITVYDEYGVTSIKLENYQ